MAGSMTILNYLGTILAVVGLLVAIAGIIYIAVNQNIDSIFWGLTIGGLAAILLGILLVVIGHWKVFASSASKQISVYLTPTQAEKLSPYLEKVGINV